MDAGASPSPEIVESQLGLLRHRGADAVGALPGGRGVVAQTRLAIIDLVTGDPQIANEDRTISVALNGEIYNYRELRQDLVARGHRMSTTGDTEALAHLAEEREPGDIARALFGMFAFAIWDDGRERLVLGRDRVGKKPLYLLAR